MIGGISQKKDFNVTTDSHFLIFSYQPQHMHVHAVNKETNQVVEGYFYENTLPQDVKQQCQRVHDLYEFLQTKKSGDLQVNELDLMFKVIRIKKQKWYHLSLIRAQQTSENSAKIQSDRSFKRNAAKNVISLEKEYLLEQNRRLKQLISTISKSYEIKNSDILKDSFFKKISPFVKNNNSHLGCISAKIQKMLLQVNKQCLGFSKYSLFQNTIQKVVQQPAILLFSNKITRNQDCSFSIKINSELHNNWIVLGLMSRQHFSRSFCYFMKKSFAFSGSVGIVFAEMQVLNCSIQPSRGDLLSVQITDSILRWKINGKLFCLHLIPTELEQTELFPYLMLAQPGDSITINATNED